MARTVLLVGTRKGCFVLESDDDRTRLERPRAVLRGLADLPRRARSGTGRDLRGCGERVARRGRLAQPRPRRDLGAVERGPRLRRGRPEAVEDLRPDRGARPPARRRRGVRRSSRAATAASPGRCSARSTASPAATTGTTRPTSLRAISACRRSSRTRTTRRASGRSCRASASSRPPTTARSWTPRNRGPAGRLAARGPRGRLLRAQARDVADRSRAGSTSRTTVGMHRSDDGGHSWVEITEGLPTEFGFAAAAHPHDRDSFYVIPLDPGPRALHAGRPGRRLAHARCRLELAAARPRPAAARRASRRAARGDGDRLARRPGPVLRHEHRARSSRAPTRARAGARSRATCPRSRRSKSRSHARLAHGRPPSPAPRCRRSSPTCRVALESTRRPSTRRSTGSTSAGPACATGCASPGRCCARTSTSTSTAGAPGSTPRSTPRLRVDVIAAISGG